MWWSTTVRWHSSTLNGSGIDSEKESVCYLARWCRLGKRTRKYWIITPTQCDANGFWLDVSLEGNVWRIDLRYWEEWRLPFFIGCLAWTQNKFERYACLLSCTFVSLVYALNVWSHSCHFGTDIFLFFPFLGFPIPLFPFLLPAHRSGLLTFVFRACHVASWWIYFVFQVSSSASGVWV